MCSVKLLAMLLANALTAFRLVSGVAIPFGLCFQFNPLGMVCTIDHRLGVFILAILAALSDTIDGAVAKLFGGTTEFGKNFDPSADAVLCIGIATAILMDAGMTLYAIIFYWLPSAVAFVYTVAVIRMRWKEQIQRSNWDARFGMGCFMFAGIMILGRIALNDPSLESAGIAGIVFGVYCQFSSLATYRKAI